MHGYLYVDWNGDKSFTRELNEWVPTDESELIAYGFWVGRDGDGSHGNVDDRTGYNHLGNQVSDSTTPDRSTNGALEAFTIPANIPAGDYRARYKLDWNCINPDATLDTNQGAMVLDFTLRVTQAVVPTYTVTVSVNDDAMGTADKQAGENDTYTLTATAKNGYEFVNWTVEGEVVSSEATYTFTAEADIAVVANFQIVAEWPETMTLIETAEALAANEGVGYPNADTKVAFQAIINEAKANSTIEQVEILETAIEEYYNTTDIEMPVAGNVYAFIGKGYTSASDCYLWNNEGVLSIASYSEGTTELPESAYFSCEVVDGQYMFKTVDGQYYMAFPSPGKNWLYNKSENGLEPTVSNLTKFDILKIVQTTRVQKATSDMFGQVYMWGCRGNGNSANGDLSYGSMIVKSGAWDGAGEPYCDSTPQSSAFSIVEVSYTPVYAVSAEASPANAGEVTISANEVEENGTVELTAVAATGYIPHPNPGC